MITTAWSWSAAEWLGTLKVLELITALAKERRSTKIKTCAQDVPEFTTD